jgi:uncharacterized phiE125 gp8 family phage protein
MTIHADELESLIDPTYRAPKGRPRWASIEVTDGPNAWPIAWADIKDYVPIDDAAHEPTVTELAKAATRLAEGWTGLAFIARTAVVTWDAAWWGREVPLPAPTTAVGWVKSYASDNTATTLSASVCRLDANRAAPRLLLNDHESWPRGLRRTQPMQAEVTWGFGATAADVPHDLKVALRQMVGTLFENPVAVGGLQADQLLATIALTPSVQALLWPFRDMR